MSKPSKDTVRAFIVASSVGGIIMANDMSGRPDVLILKRQVDRAMKTFSHKAPKLYKDLSKEVNDIWVELGKGHNTTIDEDEVPYVIEYFLKLIPDSHSKAFLAMPQYQSGITVSKEKESLIMATLLDFNEEINKRFGTKSYTMPIKKVKAAKIKKVRDKSKKVNAHALQVAKDKATKERKKLFLAGIKARVELLREEQI